MELGKSIGVFSDTHIGLYNNSHLWHTIILEFAEWAATEFVNRGINDIIIPGDIFHNRSEIGVSTISVAKKFFEFFEDFNLYISTGNHCCYYKDKSDINSISILSGWKNITIVDTIPLILNYKNKKISLIPWGVDVENIPNSDICFGHFEIQSFYMNSNKICENGVKSHNLFKKSPLIVSGHFHNKDERVYDKGKIVYLGSPYQQNFGDCDQKRGIYTLDLETNELNFIENTLSPVHIKLFLSKMKKGDQNSDFLKKNVKNKIISLIIDQEIDSEKITILASKLQFLKPKSIRIDYESIDRKIVEFSENKDYNMLDMEKSISDFVNSLDIKYKEEVADHVIALYKELKK